MGIENPRFLPDKEPSQTFTPEELIRYVREREQLPAVSQEGLQRLNDEMTQEQIVDYHVTVNTLEDQEKSRALLDSWIPRPKVLYHASRSGDIDEFEPRGRFKRRPDDPPQVFGATSEAVAAMMMAPGGDQWHKSGSYDGGRTWTFIYVDSDEFRAADTGGYIYELPPEDFSCDPHIGMGLAEWTAVKPIKPRGKPTQYSSSVEAMLQHGVKVYPVDSEMFRRFQDESEDDAALLQNLQPLPVPQNEKPTLSQAYDQVYSRENHVFGGGRPDAIVEKIPDVVAGGDVLDIGTGQGRHALYLARHGFSVTAIDLSEKAITQLRSVAATEKLSLEALVRDIEDMPFEKNYNVMVSSYMLHHLPRAQAVALLEKMKKHTNPGGVHAIAAFTQQGDFYRDNPGTSGFYPELGELRALYSDWEQIDYIEEEGQALSVREDGSPKVNVSARILARKPLTQ